MDSPINLTNLNTINPPNLQNSELFWPFENILVKKVNGIALNIFEWIIDYFASFFDCYTNREKELSNRVSHLPNGGTSGSTEEGGGQESATRDEPNAALILQKNIRMLSVKQCIQSAKFVDKFIEKHFKDEFNADARKEIEEHFLTHSKASCLPLSKLMALWWQLALNQKTAKDCFEMIYEHKKHFFNKFPDIPNWKKITFKLSDGIEKDYPHYILYVFAKESEYFEGFLKNQESLEESKKSKKINLEDLSEEDFWLILGTLCPALKDPKTKEIMTMEFDKVWEILIVASGYGFISIVEMCCARLSDLIAKTPKTKDNFESIIEILSSIEYGLSKDLIRTAEIFCSRYLAKLPSQKERQEALTALAETSITYLELPASTQSADLSFLPPKLQQLNLDACKELEDEGLENIKNLENLKSISIAKNEKVTALYGLNELPLEEVTIKGCPRIGDDVLIGMEEITTLKRLKLENLASFKGDWIGTVKNIKSLESLSLSGCCFIPEETFKFLDGLQLTSLDLSHCNNLTNEHVALLANSPLIELNLLSCISLTKDCLVDLLKIGSLVTLKLPTNQSLTSEVITKFCVEFKKKHSRDLDCFIE